MNDLTLFEIRSDIAAARAACGQRSAEDQAGWLLALNAVETLFCRRLGRRLDEVEP